MPWQNVGSPFIVISPANGIFLVYELPGPELGTLIASIAPTSGTDAYGNSYDAGVTAYVTINTTVFAVNLGNNLPASGTEGAGIGVNAISGSLSPAFAPGGMFGQVGVDAGNPGQDEALMWLTSGQTTSDDIAAEVILTSTNTAGYTGGGNFESTAIWNEFDGTIYIDGGPPSASSIGQAGLGLGAAATTQNPQVYCATDETVYNFGTQYSVVPTGIVLNSTSPINIHSVNVQQPGKYRFRTLIIVVAAQAAGTFSIGYAGTASVFSSMNKVTLENGATTPTYTLTTSGAMPALQTSATMTGAGEHFWYEAEGEFTVLTNGTLLVRGQVSAAADTATVATGSYTYVELMNAT
jgi:hypothetical protein